MGEIPSGHEQEIAKLEGKKEKARQDCLEAFHKLMEFSDEIPEQKIVTRDQKPDDIRFKVRTSWFAGIVVWLQFAWSEGLIPRDFMVKNSDTISMIRDEEFKRKMKTQEDIKKMTKFLDEIIECVSTE